MTIQRIEEASLNAWPARHTLLYDGWLLRCGAGYTKRANSVTALYPGTLALDEKIAACAAIYRAQGLPPVFRLTPRAPPGLEDRLAGRGYHPASPTLVQARDLPSSGPPPPGTGELRAESLDDWLAAFARLTGASPARTARHRAILTRVLTPCLYAALVVDEVIVSCGLAVVDGELAGLFDVITAPDQRGRGYGTALVGGLLAWSRESSARTAYLQVEEANAPARHLYEARFGFQTVYGYAYRVPGG